MKILCGLGNPEKKYEKTRHNVGFRLMDLLAARQNFPAFEEKEDALITSKGRGDKKIILLKPLTYMNESGVALRHVMDFYKILPKDLLVIYDDVDLPLGKLRFREKGSAGSHNGMKSVIRELGTMNFPRLRIGIETRNVTAPKEMDLEAFVLAPFLPEEEPILGEALQEALLLLEEQADLSSASISLAR